MKKALLIFFAVIAFLVVNSIIPSKEECEIYNSTVRLHVIANSDTQEDQELKLKVRDAIIAKMSTYNAKTKEEALEYINNDMENLKKTAEECIKSQGFSNSVTIEIGEESYPTREYEDFTLPAGKYTSLRIIIGEGEGQNWWCVMFPNLCIPSAANDKELEEVLTKGQTDFVEGGDQYKIKFKTVEWVQSALHKWKKQQ